MTSNRFMVVASWTGLMILPVNAGANYRLIPSIVGKIGWSV